MPSANIYRRTAIAAAISACFPAMALGAGVARVDFAIGNVTAVAPDGRSRQLSKGSEIDVGDTVSTQQGRAQLRFSDGAYMSLQPQTEFKVDEFKFSGKQADPSDNIVMSLLKGGMRTITGLIGRANRNNYRLRTDVATIGIRGTEYSVKYTNSIEVFCADGSIFLQNDGGILQLNGGQGGYVASNDTPPQQTENRPNLPPESPVDQELLEQDEVADPVNPIQEAFPPVTQTVLTGNIQGSVAHASSRFGARVSTGTSISLSPEGGLTEFFDLSRTDVTLASGTSAVQSAGNDGIVAWGRWVGGQPTEDGIPFSLTDSLHYVVGLPVTNMPTTGSATYSMIGATTPSFFGGNITGAAVTSSSINVDFLWSAATVNIDMTLNTVNGASNINVSTNPLLISNGQFGGGIFSVSSCTSGSVNGFLAGDGAARAGVAYDLSVFDNASGAVVGTIAYERGALGSSSASNPIIVPVQEVAAGLLR